MLISVTSICHLSRIVISLNWMCSFRIIEEFPFPMTSNGLNIIFLQLALITVKTLRGCFDVFSGFKTGQRTDAKWLK